MTTNTIANPKTAKGMTGKLNEFFEISKRGSSIKTEISAGLTTFMTMAYIMIVHPNIMGAAGMDVGAMTVVTALMSGIFTLFMGLYAKIPFALAPAMGSNAFLAYTLVKGGMATWQQGIGMVFVSGVVFVVLTLFGVREAIVTFIPRSVKVSIGSAVGLFIAQLGFSNVGLLAFNNGSLKLGNIHTPQATLAMIGFVIIITLMAFKIKGALLYAMLITTVIGIPMGITKVPASLISAPPSIAPIAFKLDIIGALKLSFIPLMFTFFVGDFFSTLGTLLGVSAKADLLDKDGNLPGIEKPFLVDAIGTVVGALFGTTVVTTFVESASGVEAGGRTGLTAVVTSICFFLMLFLTPVAQMIPNAATSPILIIIGLLMMSSIKEIDFDNFTEALPAFLTIIISAYTFSLSNGISLGILSYVFLKVITGKFRELSWGVYVFCIPLIAYFMAL